MAQMRVHELAKEFNLSSKEMLDAIRKMKIPAKSHASMLEDDQVAQIRAAMSTSSASSSKDQSGAKGVAKSAEEQEREREEQLRREAVEKERARRAAEQAKRENAQEKEQVSASSSSATHTVPAPAASTASPFKGLEEQIAAERLRVRQEKARREQEERNRRLAAAVAKRQRVEEQLRSRGKKTDKSTSSTALDDTVSASSDVQQASVKTHSAQHASRFDALLSQIESEKKRIAHGAAQVPQHKKTKQAPKR